MISRGLLSKAIIKPCLESNDSIPNTLVTFKVKENNDNFQDKKKFQSAVDLFVKNF